MRLSQNMMYQNNLNSILDNQQEVNKAMQQVNTQKRVITASDDPSAMARALLYTDKIQINEQHGKNLTMLKNRLSTQETVLNGIKDGIDSAYSKAIQAGNGSLANVDRHAIADEIESIQSALLSLMNTQSEDGRYIFSGYQDNTKTYQFNATTGSYDYQGDQGQHKIKIAEGVAIKSSDNGFDTFENVAARLNVTSNTATPGAGVTAGTVYVEDQGAFDAFHKANYNADPTAPATANTLTLDMAPGTPNTYQLSQGGTVISTGTFEGNTLEVAGMAFGFSGTLPGSMDFTLAAPEKKNILTTLEELTTALRDDTLSGDDYRQRLADAMVGFDNAKAKVSSIQSALGGRLNTATLISDANADQDISNKSAKADLVELDMAEAITELTKHETALQASQATFGRLSNLTLLDYIR
ncbi:flagellar hook-associated protein FlgL [Pseudoalteromonas rubra]|uniref:flagellar hook-associated protein FlgL n=1 Tax=Pseudoalteromonas rubra TaxID=43658 RepID=UPI000F773571|nr:flagellar hook-associated protein FlgL [Pseudoalteromonas rubra]